DRQLERQQARWHRRPAAPRALVRGLHSVDGTMIRLGRSSDEPTGAVLVVPSGDGLEVLDIDRSSVSSVAPATGGTVIGRRGFVVDVRGDLAVATLVDGGRLGSSHPLGPAAFVVPALRDDAVWLVVVHEPTAGTRSMMT